MKKEDRKYIFTGLFFLMLFFITICAFQNQSRYAMMLLPAIFVAFAVVVDRTTDCFKLGKITSLLFVLVIFAFLAVDFVLADFSKNDGIECEKMVAEMRSAYTEYIPQDSLVLDAGQLSTISSYAIDRPFLKASALSEHYVQFFDYVTPDYIIASEDTQSHSVLDSYEVIHTFDVSEIPYRILKIKE